jgi:signal transduction histidine kinase
VYVVLAPAAYAVIRVLPAGGGVTPIQAVLDSVYSIILGGVITIIVTMLRTAASAVDRAQQTALIRYSHAVRQHAIEAERVQVDAIVHDSVLTTFLSAARALTPEAKQLAATMAGNAIGHLRDASGTAPDSDAVVGVGVVASRIADAASTMSQPFEVRTSGVGPGTVPIAVAEAVYSAAVQAMVNSLQHAGPGVRRWAAVRGEDGGIVVEIGDEGRGFDPESVPTERLGVRVSILERVASAGGEAALRSAPGEGTRVTLAWPATGEAAR